ncbi:hypothetical protein, partial [Streptomyces sp. FBKL.4005]|uniref:hypothetical protein n=1 Tax=Streptomyces sp. FBKL.4005 TaxID=2015515 RepID=UPI001CB9A977
PSRAFEFAMRIPANPNSSRFALRGLFCAFSPCFPYRKAGALSSRFALGFTTIQFRQFGGPGKAFSPLPVAAEKYTEGF